MKNKKVFLLLGVFFLGDILIKAILGLTSAGRSGEYSIDISSLVLELILIAAIGIFINEKNWRILCLIVGVNIILMQIAPLTPKNLNLALYVFSILSASMGFMNLLYFYKSEFDIPKTSNSKSLLLSIAALILLIFIIFAIFLFYGTR